MECTNTEAAIRGVLWRKAFLEISQNSMENTCARVSFLHCSLFTIWRLYDYSSSGSSCVTWCFSKFGNILSKFVYFFGVSCWRAMSCFWFGFYVIVHIIVIFSVKDAFTGLRQFLPNESPLKMMKKCFLFHFESSFCFQDI